MCSAGNQGEGGILAVAFESPDSLLLARGSAVKPVFERMKIPKGSSSKAAQIELPRIMVRLCPPPLFPMTFVLQSSHDILFQD